MYCNFASAADGLEQKIQKITGYFSSTLMKTIGALIIIAVAIYFLKNLERWKEVGLACLSIILGSLAITHSQAIAQWLF
ncbi:hypothetical protein BKH41_01950 [Helicobacter sp. 12S02232-10]|nr:hypothetical protein BKH41_01950 [Helicobacter sp. 12S02232-10]